LTVRSHCPPAPKLPALLHAKVVLTTRPYPTALMSIPRPTGELRSSALLCPSCPASDVRCWRSDSTAPLLRPPAATTNAIVPATPSTYAATPLSAATNCLHVANGQSPNDALLVHTNCPAPATRTAPSTYVHSHGKDAAALAHPHAPQRTRDDACSCRSYRCACCHNADSAATAKPTALPTAAMIGQIACLAL